ncbi:MAG: hypothetical protein JST19_10830 [Bacteroidetes bacterium]|nr:hypothetical protein [Bacteroidota bacterium]
MKTYRAIYGFVIKSYPRVETAGSEWHTTMKIITAHTNVNAAALREHIRQNLDRMFAQQRQENVHFEVGGEGNVIEISEPSLYGFLYKIEINGAELDITRSEHWTDDVNSLTVESILNELLAGKYGTDLLQEG